MELLINTTFFLSSHKQAEYGNLKIQTMFSLFCPRNLLEYYLFSLQTNGFVTLGLSLLLQQVLFGLTVCNFHVIPLLFDLENSSSQNSWMCRFLLFPQGALLFHFYLFKSRYASQISSSLLVQMYVERSCVSSLPPLWIGTDMFGSTTIRQLC